MRTIDRVPAVYGHRAKGNSCMGEREKNRGSKRRGDRGPIDTERRKRKGIEGQKIKMGRGTRTREKKKRGHSQEKCKTGGVPSIRDTKESESSRGKRVPI